MLLVTSAENNPEKYESNSTGIYYQLRNRSFSVEGVIV